MIVSCLCPKQFWWVWTKRLFLASPLSSLFLNLFSAGWKLINCVVGAVLFPDAQIIIRAGFENLMKPAHLCKLRESWKAFGTVVGLNKTIYGEMFNLGLQMRIFNNAFVLLFHYMTTFYRNCKFCRLLLKFQCGSLNVHVVPECAMFLYKGVYLCNLFIL